MQCIEGKTKTLSLKSPLKSVMRKVLVEDTGSDQDTAVIRNQSLFYIDSDEGKHSETEQRDVSQI